MISETNALWRSRLRTGVKAAALAGCMMVLAACAATFQNHGYTPSEEDLSAIVVGVDTRDTVEDTIGKPAASGVLSDTAWYYVSSRNRHWAYRAPETVERELVAVSFGDTGTVTNIERFGLEDGQIITLSRRVTDTSIREFGLIQQLIRNFGRINIGEALARDR
jgi:outer membrane protein assembly factor BamE (lipoprotein component of BamABCDE complex)